jgi:Lipopolysaccharide-assembly
MWWYNRSLDESLVSRRWFVLDSCFLLFICLMAGCGYQLRADGEPVGITLENLAIPLFTSTSTDIGFEANFTRIVREEFISHARVPLVPEERAHTVLIGRITEIRTDPIGYDSQSFTVNDRSGTFVVTKTRRLKIRLDVQLVDRVQGKVIWHDASIEERSSFQVETDPLATQFFQEQALEKLARRAAKKMYQRTLERF